jgi:hypothetical protein
MPTDIDKAPVLLKTSVSVFPMETPQNLSSLLYF